MRTEKILLTTIIMVGLLLIVQIATNVIAAKNYEKMYLITTDTEKGVYSGYYNGEGYIVIFNDVMTETYRELFGYNETELHEYAHYAIDQDYQHFCEEWRT